MASRDGDISLWLHNKLGSTDDLWSGKTICSQLSREKLLSIQDCFHSLQPYVKVKLMLSFLHLPKRNVEELKVELEEILQMAQDDTDQWVAMIGNILRTYPATGTLNTDVDESHAFFHEVLTDLKKTVKKYHDASMMPMECSYLNRGALLSVASHQPQLVKHFTLKRKPKSAALRAELLQKSTEAASNLKRTGGITIPVKFRSFAKKLDDNTSPGKGMGHKTNAGGGFLKANSLNRAFGGTSALGNRSNSSRKEGGIKLLDIGEQPVGGKEAKRRRKQAEQEVMEQHRKEKEAQNATPDYAAGLMTPAVAGTAVLNPAGGAAGPSYVPTVTRLPSATSEGAVSLPTNSLSAATQQARENLQQQLQQQLVPGAVRATTVVSGAPAASLPVPTPAATTTTIVVQQQQVPAQAQAIPGQPQKKGLSLTREQMLEAQDMFKVSNKVTRPEKALILGFMAGSRDNPCPQQGDIVNIRLSESDESVQQPDGTFLPMLVDMYFQMNYATGQWKKIRKCRPRETE